jgi:SAM-dependent methyltransferase
LRDLGAELRRLTELLAIKLKGYRPERHMPEDWTRQYETGAWAYLADLSERPRYSVMVGYLAALAPRHILDVGCGEGLLARKIRHLPFETYVGIDFSPAPVAAARAALGDDLRLTFAVADAESYQPATEPDAIIFSECLNYLSDPVGIIEHYSKSIASNGFIIISLFQSPPCRQSLGDAATGRRDHGLRQYRPSQRQAMDDQTPDAARALLALTSRTAYDSRRRMKSSNRHGHGILAAIGPLQAEIARVALYRDPGSPVRRCRMVRP